MDYYDFFELSIEKILNGYQDGTIRPTDIAKICIDRVNRMEPNSLAWVTFSSEKLMVQAESGDKRIECHARIRQIEGIPIGIKDIYNTEDFVTEMGSPIWKDFTPGNDARVVYNLIKEGGLIPGKTVTAEFAVHTLGQTLNPHDPTKTPGTSSSGSAVAVATGMIPVAIGSQTAGSIVRPASFCGIYGCKPSFGLVPRTGMLKTTDSLDTVGYFCLHFIDLERIFNIIRVHGKNYPISNNALTDIKRQNKPENRPYRVAFVKTHVWSEAYLYAQQAILRWIDILMSDENIIVQHTNLPEGMESTHEIHKTIYDKTLSYYFKDEFENNSLISPIMNDLIKDGNKITQPEYEKALKRQNYLGHKMDVFFEEFDILISLSTAGEAPMREEEERPDPALMWTMCHLPVISAPVFTSPNGLPFGVQIVARRYNDLLLFKFCNYLRECNFIPEKSNPQIPI